MWADLPADCDFYVRAVGPLVPAASAVQRSLSIPLGGGIIGFSAVEISAARHGRQIAHSMIPVPQLDSFVATLSENTARPVRDQIAAINRPRGPLDYKDHIIAFDQGPKIMGVVNVTPDSFSDGGDFAQVDAAVAHGHALAAAGAHILDIGGESTRPGAKPVWEEEEKRRVIPVIEALVHLGVPLSIDTRRAGVMAAALKAGAMIINDVSALTYDGEDAMAVARDSGAPVVLMHAAGDPQTMQNNPSYANVPLDVFDWLAQRIDACDSAGILRDRLVIDPGIGFGKTVRHNLDLINGLSLFHSLGIPILLGASRKRFIGALTGAEEPKDRLPGSLAIAMAGLVQGVQLLRVHDVAETKQLCQMWQGLTDAAVMAGLEQATALEEAARNQ